MSYQQTQLINRLVQFGKVNYDLVLRDPDGVLPDLRHSISIPEAEDIQQRRNAIRQTALDRANQENSPASRRERLQAERDEIDQQRQQLQDRRDALQDRLDRGDV